MMMMTLCRRLGSLHATSRITNHDHTQTVGGRCVNCSSFYPFKHGSKHCKRKTLCFSLLHVQTTKWRSFVRKATWKLISTRCIANKSHSSVMSATRKTAWKFASTDFIFKICKMEIKRKARWFFLILPPLPKFK
jgi:hypothetical protein